MPAVYSKMQNPMQPLPRIPRKTSSDESNGFSQKKMTATYSTEKPIYKDQLQNIAINTIVEVLEKVRNTVHYSETGYNTYNEQIKAIYTDHDPDGSKTIVAKHTFNALSNKLPLYTPKIDKTNNLHVQESCCLIKKDDGLGLVHLHTMLAISVISQYGNCGVQANLAALLFLKAINENPEIKFADKEKYAAVPVELKPAEGIANSMGHEVVIVYINEKASVFMDPWSNCTGVLQYKKKNELQPNYVYDWKIPESAKSMNQNQSVRARILKTYALDEKYQLILDNTELKRRVKYYALKEPLSDNKLENTNILFKELFDFDINFTD